MTWPSFLLSLNVILTGFGARPFFSATEHMPIKSFVRPKSESWRVVGGTAWSWWVRVGGMTLGGRRTARVPNSRNSTRLHSTPRHATPRHSTRLHSTLLNPTQLQIHPHPHPHSTLFHAPP